MVNVDGSFGEGGGQILRTALALSLVTGLPFRIERIRAARRRPGLLRQHLTAVRAAAAVGGAEVSGAEMGSGELTFAPKEVVPDDYRFEVGSAGSATLVLQTVLPALMTARGPSSLALEGGTHNPLAPPFEFIEKAFLPVIRRMGPEVTAALERPGFHPAGGGRFRVAVRPCPRLSRVDLLERGPVRAWRARALVARLPRHIAERELRIVEQGMRLGNGRLEVEEVRDPIGPGNVLMIEIEAERVTEVFSGFGERGVRAEEVARRALGEANRYLEAGVPVGEHLADQLLLPFTLAGGGSFATLPLTPHARTNLEVLGKFVDVRVRTEPIGRDALRVDLEIPGSSRR